MRESVWISTHSLSILCDRTPHASRGALSVHLAGLREALRIEEAISSSRWNSKEFCPQRGVKLRRTPWRLLRDAMLTSSIMVLVERGPVRVVLSDRIKYFMVFSFTLGRWLRTWRMILAHSPTLYIIIALSKRPLDLVEGLIGLNTHHL